MAKLIEMDEKVKFSDQIKEDAGPIVFINKFTVNTEDLEHFMKLGSQMLCTLRANRD
jgi:hypothetical protein